MIVYGAVEHIAPDCISGWCVDTQATEPASVELRVNSVLLMSVRSDIYRSDIEKTHLQRPLSGFRLPISQKLQCLLPHGGVIEVFANGYPLQLLPNCNPFIDSPAVPSIDSLLEKLESGYIITPKYGDIFLPVLKQGDHLTQTLACVELGCRIFREVTGKQLFICYGTLLGYIRDNDFIEHDDDIDLCFLADSNGWDAAFEEFMDVVEKLRMHGENIWIDSGIHFHWYFDGDLALDIFMGWMEGSNLNMYSSGGVLPRERILPLQPRRFKGLDVLIPNDPEALLQLLYGEMWRVPDPNFQWKYTPEVTAMMKLHADAMVDVKHRERRFYWSRFYEHSQRMAAPSSFAASVTTELAEPCWIVDMGCGDGRDSFFFASLGHWVLGLDVVGAVIESNRAFANHSKLDRVAFQKADLSTPGMLAAALRGHAEQAFSGSDVVAYGRFFFHAISDDEEAVILESLAGLPSGARCYFEFRTTKDANLAKRFPDHYRRFVDVDTFVERASETGELDCLYRIEGQGMAKCGDEDPFVGRVHLRRR